MNPTISFSNVPPGERIWLLIDGTFGDQVEWDRPFWTDNRTLKLKNVGPVGAGPQPLTQSVEIMAFVRGRQPLRSMVNWNNPPAKPLRFQSEQELPITIWILSGEFRRERRRALNNVLVANGLFFQENAGVRVRVSRVIDATGESHKTDLVNAFDWGDIDKLREQISWMKCIDGIQTGLVEGEINVFYTECPRLGDDFIGTAGMGGGSGFIVIGQHGLDDLLFHELGHVLGQTHPDETEKDENPELFNRANWMSPKSAVRWYITEGQIARIHFNGESAVHAIYGYGRSSDIKPCFKDSTKLDCPRPGISLSENEYYVGDESNELPYWFGHDMRAWERTQLMASSSRLDMNRLDGLLYALVKRFEVRNEQLIREIARGRTEFDSVDFHRLRLETYVATEFTRIAERILANVCEGS